ncbi:MAG: hypothetical protein ACM33B_02660 [Pseudomonadota bacterium]
MRVLALALAAAALAMPSAASADDDTWIGDPPPCGDTTVASLSVVDCDPPEAVPSLDASTPQTREAVAAFVAAAGVPQEFPPYCRLVSTVFFYTSTDWVRLAETMAAEASPCADYYFSIPALANDKTELRGPLQPELIRALGPRFHAVAEIHFTGWSGWVNAAPGRTWCAAGVEARRRMEDKNYRVSLGDTWSINELTSAVRQGAGNARRNAQEFIRCLYDGGDGSVTPNAGNVFIVGLGQGTTPTTVYKENLKRWFADAPFWQEMARSVRWWGQEVYGSPRYTLVPETSRNERSRSLSDYLYGVANLAESGPDEIAPARSFLRAAHYPLGSAAWRYASGFGFTEVPLETMQQFTSFEEYSMRHTLGSRPQTASPYVGYAWSLRNANPVQPASVFTAETLALAQRVAAAIRFTLAQGGSAPPGACGPPGEHVWCAGAWEGATFNAEWALLTFWDA